MSILEGIHAALWRRCMGRGARIGFASGALVLFGPGGVRAQAAGATDDASPAAASPNPTAPVGEAVNAGKTPPAGETAPAKDTETDAHPTEPEPGAVVTGKTGSAAARDSSAPVTIIDTTQARTQTSDLGELLARTEGVGIRRSAGLGSNTRLSLNGFTGDQVRILIDGVPIEASGFGLGTSNIPVDFIDRVEIYQGVVPIGFGVDALGGVVNLVTRRDIEGTGGSATLQVGAFGTVRVTAGAQHALPWAGLYARAFAAVDRADNDYRVDVQVADATGRTHPAEVTRFHDGYDATSGGVEVGVRKQTWADHWMLRAFASQYDKEIQSNLTMQIPYGEVTSGGASYGLLMHYDKRFFDRRLTLRSDTGVGNQSNDFQDEGAFIYDWFGQQVGPRAAPGEISNKSSDRTIETLTAYERFDAVGQIAPGHELELAAALTYASRDGVERDTEHDTVDLLAIERAMTRVNAGLAYHLDLFNRIENTVFGKVYYYTAHTVDLTGAGSFTHGSLSGGYVERGITHSSIGYGDTARLRLVDALYLKGSYEHATRLPRPDELFGDNVFVKANDDLQPETSDNFNLGLQYESGRTVAGDFVAELTGFMRVAKDLIAVLGATDYELRYQNLVDATAKGAQGSLRWRSPDRLLTLGGNGTWLNFRNRSKAGYYASFYDVRMPNTPYLFANANGRVNLRRVFSGNDELSLDWHVRYVHAFYRAWENVGIKSTKQTIPEQTIHSLALVYAVTGAERRLVTTIECANLTDQQTFDFFGQQRPGRAIYWKGTIEFF